MNIKLALPARLILGILFMGCFIAPPHALPQTQDTSTASLQDTLTWLRDFLPTATGGTDYPPVYVDGIRQTLVATSALNSWNGCQLTIAVSQNSSTSDGKSSTGVDTMTFSLADISAASIRIDTALPNGWTGQSINIKFTTSGSNSISLNHSGNDGLAQGTRQQSFGAIGGFLNQAGAERVANALRHAVDLCAKPQSF